MENFNIEKINDYITPAEKFMLAYLLEKADNADSVKFAVDKARLMPFVKIEMEGDPTIEDEAEALVNMLTYIMCLPCTMKIGEEYVKFPFIEQWKIGAKEVSLTMTQPFFDNLHQSIINMITTYCNSKKQVFMLHPGTEKA